LVLTKIDIRLQYSSTIHQALSPPIVNSSSLSCTQPTNKLALCFRSQDSSELFNLEQAELAIPKSLLGEFAGFSGGEAREGT